jgi:hypothetical protein
MQTIAPARSCHPRAVLAVLLVAPFLTSVDARIRQPLSRPSGTPGGAHASHAFGLTSLALAVAAALAAVGAYLPTHVSDDLGRPNRAAKPRHPADLITATSQGSKP